MSRSRHPGLGPARWHVTVASADAAELLWHGDPATRSEAEALAIEARRLRPEAVILIKPPAGHVYRYEGN